jgi:hypothetical protein
MDDFLDPEHLEHGEGAYVKTTFPDLKDFVDNNSLSG